MVCVCDGWGPWDLCAASPRHTTASSGWIMKYPAIWWSSRPGVRLLPHVWVRVRPGVAALGQRRVRLPVCGVVGHVWRRADGKSYDCGGLRLRGLRTDPITYADVAIGSYPFRSTSPTRPREHRGVPRSLTQPDVGRPWRRVARFAEVHQ